MEVKDAVILWLTEGETGQSSRFMASVLSGVVPKEVNYPHDPADFKRCVFLLNQIPDLRKDLNKLRSHSPVWDIYVQNWDKMESLLKEELPKGEGPKLFELMQDLQKQVKEL